MWSSQARARLQCCPGPVLLLRCLLQKPAANSVTHLALKPPKADRSCKISTIFTVELESLLPIFFSFCHTNSNFFLPFFFILNQKLLLAEQRKECRTALPHWTADYNGAALHFDATLISFALSLFNHFCLSHLKLWTQSIREKTSIWDCKHSWSLSSPLKINYHSCLLVWAFDKNTDIMHQSTSIFSPAETLRKHHISYMIQLTAFFPWQWFPTYLGYYIQFGNMWKYSSRLHSLTLILFVDSPRFPLPRI